MILYITDRNGAIVGEYSHFFDDRHHLELTAGASTFEFSVKKTSEDTSILKSGNGVILRDRNDRDWFFVILSTEETQYQVKVTAEDASIELLNRMMDELPNTGAHPFSYYVNQIIDKTPWRLNVDQTQGKTRALTYTGQDTGLGRLLSIAKGFDNVELAFHVRLNGLRVVDQYIDVVNQMGSDRTNDIQISYQAELNNMTKTESRAKFVTAMRGIGSVIQQEGTETAQPEKHVDFSDIAYDDGVFRSPKGDPWIYADAANREFNENHGHIEGLYSYDTDSNSELFNRTLAQLKIYSEPSVTYEAEVKKIDPTLGLGDTVRIIDHEFKDLYLQARVSQLDLSYTDPSKNTIQFANYQVLTSNIDERIAYAVNQLPQQKNFLWLAYADDDQGNGFSHTPVNKAYIAFKYNNPTNVPSDNPDDYKGLWVKILGPEGAKGADGKSGVTYYFHTAWADTVSGGGLTTDKTAAAIKNYLGTYTDTNIDPSTDPALYTWVYIRGPQGETPDMKDVDRIFKQHAQPVGTDSNPLKTGDMWWKISDGTDGKNVAVGEVIAMHVYNEVQDPKWQSMPINEKTLNIQSLNAVTVNGSTINGSEFTVNFRTETPIINTVEQGTMRLADGVYSVKSDVSTDNGKTFTNHQITELTTDHFLARALLDGTAGNKPDTPATEINISSTGVDGSLLPAPMQDENTRQLFQLSGTGLLLQDQWESILLNQRYLHYTQKPEYGGNNIQLDFLDIAKNSRVVQPGYTTKDGTVTVPVRPRAIIQPSIGNAGHGMVFMWGAVSNTNTQPAWTTWDQLVDVTGLPAPRLDDYKINDGWLYGNENLMANCIFENNKLSFATRNATLSGWRNFFIQYLY